TGQTDIIVGAPVANRNRAEIEPLVGLFLNTLALRTDLSGAPTFREVLGRARRVALEAFSNQDIPFEKLLQILKLDRDLDRAPLFQVLINMRERGREYFRLTDVTARYLDLPTELAKCDLSLEIEESGSQLV